MELEVDLEVEEEVIEVAEVEEVGLEVEEEVIEVEEVGSEVEEVVVSEVVVAKEWRLLF